MFIFSVNHAVCMSEWMNVCVCVIWKGWKMRKWYTHAYTHKNICSRHTHMVVAFDSLLVNPLGKVLGVQMVNAHVIEMWASIFCSSIDGFHWLRAPTNTRVIEMMIDTQESKGSSWKSMWETKQSIPIEYIINIVMQWAHVCECIFIHVFDFPFGSYLRKIAGFSFVFCNPLFPSAPNPK